MSSSDHDYSTEHEVEEMIFTTSVDEVYRIKIIYIVGLVIIGVLVWWAMFYMGMVNVFLHNFFWGGFAIFLAFTGYYMYFLIGVKSVTLSSRGIKISKWRKTLTYTWDQIKQTVHLDTGQEITLLLTEDGGYWTSDLKNHVTISYLGFSTDDWNILEESILNIEMPHVSQDDNYYW